MGGDVVWNQTDAPSDLGEVNVGLEALRNWAGPLIVALAATAGCTATEPEVELSSVASEGRELARSSGCAACHGPNGSGGVGPAWTGLVGTTVSFTDGTSSVVDREYLTTSITDPLAEIRTGYALRMPENSLTAEEVAKVVAYIEELR